MTGHLISIQARPRGWRTLHQFCASGFSPALTLRLASSGHVPKPQERKDCRKLKAREKAEAATGRNRGGAGVRGGSPGSDAVRHGGPAPRAAGARRVRLSWPPSWKQDFRGCVTATRGRGEASAPHPSPAWPLVSSGAAMAWTAAGSGGARGALSAHTLLFDMPPTLLGEFCAVLDSCDGALGWRGLGECGPDRGCGGCGGRRGAAGVGAGTAGRRLALSGRRAGRGAGGLGAVRDGAASRGPGSEPAVDSLALGRRLVLPET